MDIGSGTGRVHSDGREVGDDIWEGWGPVKRGHLIPMPSANPHGEAVIADVGGLPIVGIVASRRIHRDLLPRERGPPHNTTRWRIVNVVHACCGGVRENRSRSPIFCTSNHAPPNRSPRKVTQRAKPACSVLVTQNQAHQAAKILIPFVRKYRKIDLPCQPPA
jgi:hypothetical protein